MLCARGPSVQLPRSFCAPPAGSCARSIARYRVPEKTPVEVFAPSPQTFGKLSQKRLQVQASGPPAQSWSDIARRALRTACLEEPVYLYKKSSPDSGVHVKRRSIILALDKCKTPETLRGYILTQLGVPESTEVKITWSQWGKPGGEYEDWNDDMQLVRTVVFAGNWCVEEL